MPAPGRPRQLQSAGLQRENARRLLALKLTGRPSLNEDPYRRGRCRAGPLPAEGPARGRHLTQLARDGRDGLFLATTESFDAIVLDRMLPRVDGLTVLRTLRASGKELPVIVLSALGEVDERIEGLRAGGDDYLAKPFSISELLARLEALQRRSASAARPKPGHDAAAGRSRNEPVAPHGTSRRPRHRAQAQGIRAARIPDAPRRPGGDPQHAARSGVGLSLRPKPT